MSTPPGLNPDYFRRRLLDLEKELTRRLGQEGDTARSTGDDQFDPGDLARAGEIKDQYFALATPTPGCSELTL